MKAYLEAYYPDLLTATGKAATLSGNENNLTTDEATALSGNEDETTNKQIKQLPWVVMKMKLVKLLQSLELSGFHFMR